MREPFVRKLIGMDRKNMSGFRMVVSERGISFKEW
jgi:hypothetical protein